jgi:hypothetical protein
MSSTETGNQDRPLTVSVKRARELLDVGHTTIWGLIRDQKLETVSIGRKRLVIFSSLEGLVTDLRASKKEVADLL